MYLKKIEINGFKSFAEKTEIIINSQVTGVVGPNGSGKSNIADAIRWVLGEQSSKNLRGERMEDVIFHGTEKRPRKAFCQVSLIFDNQDGRIPCDYSEIVISRKMYRSGECDYLLNGSAVRLRDILDLIRDTGIGKEGYSIIGQGRIEEILASKPTARRKVFEEAAGIMKFRVRKEEAEKKLARTGENLVRVEDLLGELESRLGPMEEQAQRTREYQNLFDRQRTLDATIYLSTYEKSNARVQLLEKDLKHLEEELASLDMDVSRQAIESLSQQVEAREEEYDRLAAGRTELTTEAERIAGQQQLTAERLKSAREQQARLAQEGQGNETERLERERQLEEMSEALDEAERALAACEAEMEELAAQRDMLAASLEESRKQQESLQARRLELLDEISMENSDLSRTTAELRGVEERERELEERLRENAREVETRQRAVASERAEARGLEEKKQALTAQLNESRARLAAQRDAAAAMTQRLEAAKRAAQDVATRKKLLAEMKAEYEGYADSVKKLMTAGKRSPELGRRLIGTLAELIEVPDQYETAIEAILGGALQNVVVKEEYDAKYAIEFLRERRLGRVTFLPTKALKVGFLSERERRLAGQKGFLAVASEAVLCQPEARPAVDYLLGRTIIVDNMDNAIRIMREGGYAFRAVTLKGDVLRPGGSMTGGSTQKGRFDLLARERQLHDLETEMARRQELLAAAEEDLAKQQEVIFSNKAQGDEILKELQETEVSMAAEREKMTSSDTLLETAIARGKTMESQRDILKLSLERLQEKDAALKASLEEKNASLAQVQQALEEAAPAEHGREQLDALADQWNAMAVKRAELGKDAQAARDNRARIEGELSQMATARQARAQQTAALEVQLRQLEQEGQVLETRGAELRTTLSQAEQAILQADEEKQRLRSQLQEKQKEMADFQLKRSELAESKWKLEGQLEKVQAALEAAETRLWEDYELTYSGAAKLKIELPYSQCVRELQTVRGRIRELGPVNPTAVEEYEALRDRAAQMRLQRDDLTKAEADLSRVIADLMASMKEIFQEKFQQINRNFVEIFQTLFGGGRARLSLEEGNIMECGIQIEAEPPGKRLQHMSLLSGGERALTAIALLFALIKINPSPVCLLDEIDAPLDDANLVRFGTYLRGLKDSQFLIITHRKPTMALCDALYGVAMEEKGVSKLVSVKINQ